MDRSPQIEAVADAYRAFDIKYKTLAGQVIEFVRMKFV